MKLSEIDKAIILWGLPSQDGLSEIKQDESLIVVPEQRPSLLGLTYTLPLLKSKGIKCFYCPDNVLGFLFYQGKIKKTYLFFKDKNDKGIIGTCGSLYVSLLSKLHNVELKIMPAAKASENAADKDASTLGGQDFIFQKNKQDYIVEASEEVIV